MIFFLLRRCSLRLRLLGVSLMPVLLLALPFRSIFVLSCFFSGCWAGLARRVGATSVTFFDVFCFLCARGLSFLFLYFNSFRFAFSPVFYVGSSRFYSRGLLFPISLWLFSLVRLLLCSPWHRDFVSLLLIPLVVRLCLHTCLHLRSPWAPIPFFAPFCLCSAYRSWWLSSPFFFVAFHHVCSFPILSPEVLPATLPPLAPPPLRLSPCFFPPRLSGIGDSYPGAPCHPSTHYFFVWRFFLFVLHWHLSAHLTPLCFYSRSPSLQRTVFQGPDLYLPFFSIFKV